MIIVNEMDTISYNKNDESPPYIMEYISKNDENVVCLEENQRYIIQFVKSLESDIVIRVFDIMEKYLVTIKYRSIPKYQMDWKPVLLIDKYKSEKEKKRFFLHMYTKDELNEALSFVNMLFQLYTSSYKTGIISTKKLKKANNIIKDIFIKEMQDMK